MYSCATVLFFLFFWHLGLALIMAALCNKYCKQTSQALPLDAGSSSLAYPLACKSFTGKLKAHLQASHLHFISLSLFANRVQVSTLVTGHVACSSLGRLAVFRITSLRWGVSLPETALCRHQL